MRNFFGHKNPLWKIQKARPGKHRNSPPVWSDCGCIRASDRVRATLDAAFKVGSSRVRVVAVEDV